LQVMAGRPRTYSVKGTLFCMAPEVRRLQTDAPRLQPDALRLQPDALRVQPDTLQLLPYLLRVQPCVLEAAVVLSSAWVLLLLLVLLVLLVLLLRRLQVLLQRGHGAAADFWSFGVLLFEMTTSLPPFFSEDRHELKRRIVGRGPGQAGTLRIPGCSPMHSSPMHPSPIHPSPMHPRLQPYASHAATLRIPGWDPTHPKLRPYASQAGAYASQAATLRIPGGGSVRARLELPSGCAHAVPSPHRAAAGARPQATARRPPTGREAPQGAQLLRHSRLVEPLGQAGAPPAYRSRRTYLLSPTGRRHWSGAPAREGAGRSSTPLEELTQ